MRCLYKIVAWVGQGLVAKLKGLGMDMGTIGISVGTLSIIIH